LVQVPLTAFPVDIDYESLDQDFLQGGVLVKREYIPDLERSSTFLSVGLSCLASQTWVNPPLIGSQVVTYSF